MVKARKTRKSTTAKLTRKAVATILAWIRIQAVECGVIVRRRGIEYGIVDVDTAGNFIDADGEVLDWRECTIPKSTLVLINLEIVFFS